VEAFQRLLSTLRRLPLEQSHLPEYRYAVAIERVLSGESLEFVAREVGRPKSWLAKTSQAVNAHDLIGLIPKLEERLQRLDARRQWIAQGIGQMLLGKLTEQRFEALIPEIERRAGVTVETRVAERTATDYVLIDDRGASLCRINIKFHGTLFRGAPALVQLETEDCFALATYKIHAAHQQQDEDNYPYVFFVLSIPHLSAASVASSVPDDFVWLQGVVGRRVVEEAIATEITRPEYGEGLQEVVARMQEGTFRVISVSRAINLLHSHLFDRVYALRLPRFAQNYGRAEVDMHFSLTQDLSPVETFFSHLEHDPHHVFTTRLFKGDL
jgi:hypothetical protein